MVSIMRAPDSAIILTVSTEDDDDEDDMDDDEYAYEDDFPSKFFLSPSFPSSSSPQKSEQLTIFYLPTDDAPPRDVGAPSLGWDTLVVEPHAAMLGHHHHRHRHGTRSPFPPIPFMMGSRDPMSNFGGTSRRIFRVLTTVPRT